MGGAFQVGVGIGIETSIWRVKIEMAQAELRQEYDVHEERRRELEFLENGGNPLDFKLGNMASVSIQSTSLMDQHPEQLVTSVAKCSFPLTASPHGESFENSGTPGAPPVCEPNSADNLMLFDGENERNYLHCSRTNVAPLKQSSQLNGNQNSKELGDFAALGLPKKAYKRRNRSQPNHDGAWSSSADAALSRGAHCSSLTLGHGPGDARVMVSVVDNQKDPNISSNSNSKPTSPSESLALKTFPSYGQSEMKLDGVLAVESTCGMTKGGLPDVVSDANASKSTQDNQNNQCLNLDVQKAPRQMVSEGTSCTHACLTLNDNDDIDVCTNLKSIGMNGNAKEQNLACEGRQNLEGDELRKKENETQAVENCSFTIDTCSSVRQNHLENGSILKQQEESSKSVLGSQNEMKDTLISDAMEPVGLTVWEMERKPSDMLGDISTSQDEYACACRLQGSGNSSIREFPEAPLSIKVAMLAPEQQVCSEVHSKSTSKADEDSILEEARIIEVKCKRIAELSAGILLMENHRKSHWDFVIEEMSWLANDFAQECLWKITAAAQLAHQVAMNSQLRFEERKSFWKQKWVGHTLAKAVMEFWHSVEENLFYAVPAGAIETYRKSFESHAMQCEKTATCMQEQMDPSANDAVTEFGSQERACVEDEEETSTYYLPGAFKGSRSSKFVHKKSKKLTKGYGAGSYEGGANSPFAPCMENNQQPALIRKQPASGLNVSIPTKRMRTASRQSVLSLSSAGTSGYIQVPSKADVQSHDTNSFQDNQSTLHCGSQIPSSLEVESVGLFEKQLPFDCAEVTKPKKKKKAKHLSSTYVQRWQLDSKFQNGQTDHSIKRLDSHQLESNGNGLFGYHIVKKPKIMRQSLDNSFENPSPTAGSIPSPVASQMSNMSNPSKFISILGGQDRGQKTKVLKMPDGSVSPWSPFEDQALVVLVHDMGPNWELVSDAINSILHFKCIFRMPKECKERHKILMEKTAGDGADSAEDSGSSQPYPSTLPGIPKGSARQLFQCLQGPMEEDTLKSHFQKIIMLWKKYHHQRAEKDYQNLEQLQQTHGSHMFSLSQVCPNNLDGGAILTPLDLCDATSPSPDVLSPGYQGRNATGLAINQGAVAPMLPGSCANSKRGTSGMILGSNFLSPAGPLNAFVRDGRSAVPRTVSLSIEEQQRMQHYNQMLPARNVQQSSVSVPGALPGNDYGFHMLPGGSVMGIMRGLNRSMPMPRPGCHRIASLTMMNTGSMLSSGMVAVPSPVNMRSGAGCSQGNSMLKPLDTLHTMKPSQNPEPQGQMMASEISVQVSQGSSQVVPSFGGLTSFFSNQTVTPPVQSYLLQHQQSHSVSQQQSHALGIPNHPHPQGPNDASNTQHQAYAIRLAKERNLRQHLVQQQQQQFAASNALMPLVLPQSELPLSSPMQNSSQIQSKTSLPV